MRVTLSIPEQVARQFQAAVPPRERSRLVTALLSFELKRREAALEAACREANKDQGLAKEIEEWQSFEDAAPE